MDLAPVGGGGCAAIHNGDAQAVFGHGQRRMVGLHRHYRRQAHPMFAAGLVDAHAQRVFHVERDDGQFGQCFDGHAMSGHLGGCDQALGDEAVHVHIGQRFALQRRQQARTDHKTHIGFLQQQT